MRASSPDPKFGTSIDPIVRWIGFAILGLYALSIPWYRESGAVPRIVFGLPDWVAVAIASYVAVATLTALAWLRVPFDEDDDADVADDAHDAHDAHDADDAEVER